MSERTAQYVLSLENITAGYRSKPVIHSVTMHVQKGELCALLGRNGSGKTTLLKAVCGLIPVQEGTIKASGTGLTGISEKQRARHISYIPQRHSKLIGVTVLDAVLMGLNASLGLFAMPGKAGRARALTMLEKMGIAGLAGEDFPHLSEGQKQMVILTRALVQDAQVMLMDEPDSSLDFQNKHETLSKIRALVHEESKAALITLHDPHLALTYCDRLILLKDGRITAEICPQKASGEEIHTALSTIYDIWEKTEKREGS